MITITDKTNCCGCSACANICPKKCISMKADEEGFLYPCVDDSACINCKLCEKICPISNKPQTFPVLKTYAAKHKNVEIKLKSSSGGMFSALAEQILKEGGVVFGATFDKEWKVTHAYAENLQDLDKLRRSKYVQSDIGNTYQQAKIFLERGRKVLFTGTPCQIAGLKNYLGHTPVNLVTADIICHGVPSPGVWGKFLDETISPASVAAIDFRHKRFGWDNSYLSIKLKDNQELPKPKGLFVYVKNFLYRSNGKLFRLIYRLPYGISNLYERPSCHVCPFKGKNKSSDFTMGDLWGVKHIAAEMYDNNGVSVLMINSEKAMALFRTVAPDLVYKEIPLNFVTQYNPYFLYSTPPSPHRKDFFKAFSEGNSFYKTKAHFLPKGIKGYILNFLRWIGKAH